ncbi:helix-turn-helix domain-containing protein [Kitasatospora sp. NPDC001660]
MGFQGRLLSELRQSRGLTQGELATEVARAAGKRCARSTVAMWETADCTPTPDNLSALAEVLHTPVQAFFDVGPPTLKYLRTVSGYTQSRISKLLAVTGGTYADVETGRQNIPARWVPILARAFQVDERAITSAVRERPVRNRKSRQRDAETGGASITRLCPGPAS